jgi:uncharacterized protein
MRKSLRYPVFLLITLFILIIVFATYIGYDNHRFVVVRQEISIPGLPPQFDGFTILQISDLHSLRFGAHQEELAAGINALKYDLIAVTGDMQDHHKDLKPFLDLIHALNKKVTVLFVAGNSGPFDVDLFTGYISKDGEEIQAEGITLLERPFKVERGGARLWFSELYYGMRPEALLNIAEKRLSIAADPAQVNYYKTAVNFQEEMAAVFAGITPSDTLIGITHHPVVQAILDGPNNKMLPFDLVIAGHYHGGQIRLPLVGALYIPAPDEKRFGFFPDQRIVSGLYSGQSFQQYVSRGLGSGGSIPFLKYRLFNPPEINLITLHGAAKN